MVKKTLLVLDGHSLAFRSFFALPADSFRTAQGQYTNAVHGFTTTLLNLLKKYDPEYVAVAFDLPGGTFRTREYSEYKGGRAETPEKFKGQISVIQEVLDTIGITWLTYEDYEADDIVATLATRAENEGMDVYVASGDKDAYQLVDDQVTLLYPMPRSEIIEMTPVEIEEKTGVTPSEYPDQAALVGESADNLPGVPGVGPKTATKWIKKYGDLDGIFEHSDEIKGKVGDALRDSEEQVRLNRKLNVMVKDLPIVSDFSEIEPIGVDSEKLHSLFDALDFTQLRSRVLNEVPRRDGSEAIAETSSLREPVAHDLRSENFEQFISQHDGPWSVVVEGSGAPGLGTLERICIGAQDGHTIGGEYGSLDQSQENQLAHWLADPEMAKIGHGTKSMAHSMDGVGLTLAGISTDTELEAYLLHPDQRRYDLGELAQRYLGIELTETPSDTLGISETGELAVDNLSTHAIAILDLADAFKTALVEHQQSEVLVELELLVSHVLFLMEKRGICVDQSRLAELWSDFDARVTAAAQSAYDAIGDDTVNLSSPKQLQAVLFDQLDLPKTKKTKSGYTTNADALAELLVKIADREDDAAVSGQKFLTGLLDHRDAIKLRQSVEGLQRSVQDDSRIRTTYQQTVAATGRLSSTDPNLQNIHARTEEGLQIRSVFVPGSEYAHIMTADYSQIEMRLMAHLSGDEELVQAFNDGADLHKFVASRVYGVSEEEVTPAQRSKIKAMSYGLVYGLSAYGLSQQLHVPVSEAQQLMDEYFSRFGRVKEYLDSLVEKARTNGYTETILGRRRYLPELTSANRQVRESAERMALNAPIQGSAADIIKIAMLRVEDAITSQKLNSRMLLQVHDELVFEVADGEAGALEELVRREMGNAYKLSVPLSVSVGVGANWRDAAH